MRAVRVDDHTLRVPMRAEGPNGEVGDGLADIGPDHPQYEVWARWIDDQPEEHGGDIVDEGQPAEQ